MLARVEVGQRYHRIILDFSAIKVGGGVQRVLTFLECFERRLWSEADIYVIRPPTGVLAGREFPYAKATLTAPSGWVARAWFEYVVVRKFLSKHRIDCIFTFFGAGLPRPSRTRNVVGVAYPIVCYDESPYWKYLSAQEWWRQKLKNWLRLKRLQSATVIVAETEVMADRLAKVLRIRRDRVAVIAPTPTSSVIEVRRQPERPFVFLFLSGLAGHKNLWRLYDVLLALRGLSADGFRFLVSTDKDQFVSRLVSTHKVDMSLIDAYFEFVGEVPPETVVQLYMRADCLVNLSDLESFSNNYMEAWKAAIPQIASARDFARHILGQSALYAEPHRPDDVARAMMQVMHDAELRSRLVGHGRARLALLPTQEEAADALWRVIRG